MSAPKRNLAGPPEVAAHLDVTVQALAVMRMDGTGPAFHRVGRRIRYSWDDVAEWLESTKVRTAGDAA